MSVLKIDAEAKIESEPCVLAWDNNKLFIGTESGSVVSFDKSLSPGVTWPAHETQVFALTASDGKVYSSSNDGGVRVWTSDGNKITELPSTGADVGALYVYEQKLFTGDESGNVVIYENNTQKARYNVLEEVKDIGLKQPYMFTARDLYVTVTEIKPAGYIPLLDMDLFHSKKDLPPSLRLAGVLAIAIPDVSIFDTALAADGDESKTRFITRHAMEGRAPLRVAGSRLVVTARGGNDLQLHDASFDSKFKKLHEVKVSDMILTSLSVNEDYAWTGGWDGCVRRWKIADDQLQSAGDINFGACVNAVVASTPNTAYAVLTGGKVFCIVAA